MTFFVGIVPPPTISESIIAIQNTYGDNRLEPHITVIPPSRLNDEEQWMNAIEQTAYSFSPFDVKLTTTGYFGKGVLFIEAASQDLEKVHDQLSLVTEKYELKKPKDFEKRPYHAHLTLGRLWCGFTKEGFVEMEKLANDYLYKHISFTVEFLRIYCKAASNKSYEVYKDVQLKM